MITFQDYYQNTVKYSFEDEPFSKDPKHVWVISRYKGQWLLTRHGDRGLEFPGGKVENGETPYDAAIREVYEETGGIVSEMTYIGQYEVEGKGAIIVKNVYFAVVDRLVEKNDYMETFGPVLLDHLPDDVKRNDAYSFMMKDEILVESMKYIREKQLLHSPVEK